MISNEVRTVCLVRSTISVSRELPRALGSRFLRFNARRTQYLHPALRRNYATSNGLEGIPKATTRKRITVASDDGRVPWKDLSTTERAARTIQQTFNFGVVIAGCVGTGLVMFFLYQEVFASDSKTRIFVRAVNRIRTDPQALELLGSREKLRAYGEPGQSKWTRNRHLASSSRVDETGIEHLQMHFHVTGSEHSGVVSLHMVRGPDHSEYQYRYLALDVPGHARVYLENTDPSKEKKPAGFKMLGVQWR